MRVYLDNAASTPIIPEVIDAMTTVMREHYGNPSSIHKEGREGRALIEQARKRVAHHLQASLGEIFFTSGGTEASNMAIKCAVRDLGVTDVISCATEHHCVLHSIHEVERTRGTQVHWLPVDEWGRPSYEALRELLSSLTGKRVLVSLMHANNETGNAIDLSKYGSLCHSHNAVFHSDTVQTVGHLKHDLQGRHVDFITGAAHKFHGPKGAGFIYINNEQIVRPFVDGGSQERNMRGGTENLYGITGLAKALDVAYERLEQHRQHIVKLRQQLLHGLLELEPGLRVNTDMAGDNLYTVLSVSFPYSVKSELLLFNLDISGVATSGGSACSSGADAGSHVLRAICGEEDDMVTVRFSFSALNTAEEIAYVLTKVGKALGVKELGAGAGLARSASAVA